MTNQVPPPATSKPTLTAGEAALANVVAAYNKDAGAESGKFLVYGRSGSGKTTLIRTCPRPVLAYSFDPGGLKSVRDVIISEENPAGPKAYVYADTRFEREDLSRPTMFELLDRTMLEHHRTGVYGSVGTVVLDSLTTLMDSAIAYVLDKAGQPVMRIQDWGTLLSKVTQILRKFLALPCNVLVTTHLDFDKDEASGKMVSKLLLTGQTARKAPLFFEELYYLAAMPKIENGKETVDRVLLTANNGEYEAHTRLGQLGKLDKLERADICHILRKVGMPLAAEHKGVWKGTN